MRFKNIKINNISSFADECFFDFTLSDNKRIVLIGGQNGTGKTSLFTALKLALYGHLCFNYQSVNGQYLARVKEMISHDAFVSSSVKALIEVELEIQEERDYRNYKIRREWEFTDNRLAETLTVYQDERILSDSELLIFQNYFFTILPPNLFGFYFFDGEQIADFFSQGSSNTYLKNALLTLCNYDTFEIIRKYCENYVSNADLSNGNDVAIEYEANTESINQLEIEQGILRKKIESLRSDIEITLNKKLELETEFRNSGGLTEDEKDELLKNYRELENTKAEYSTAIRSFLETDMPFIITSALASKIAIQLDKEEEIKKFFALQDKLKSSEIEIAIRKAIEKHNISADNDLIKEITQSISAAVSPDSDSDTYIFLHDLSKEQRERVQNLLNTISNFNASKILKSISEKEKSTQGTITINKKLRESMSENDAEAFSKELMQLTNKQFDLQNQIEAISKDIELNQETIQRMVTEQKVLFEKLKENAKYENVYSLTRKISFGLDSMIKTLIASKFKQIENETLAMLKKILRKDSFIDLVELDENFNLYLYKEQIYQLDELENLVRNIGHEELEKRIGKAGTARLLETFSIDSVSRLRSNIKKLNGQRTMFNTAPISLYKRIELNQLSKGEKQIFILALYYAIIKVSGKDIPFIIDTPYARIDTEHREQISKEFFPNISSQVVILSTDEEVTKHYYNVLKPFIAKEYLLEYDETASRTVVSGGYFFKE